MPSRTEMRSITTAVLVLVASCGPSAESKRKADSAYAATVVAAAVGQAGDVLLARREAQESFDSARAKFVAHDAPAAAANLREAALFIRGHVDSAGEPAKSALTAAANELDTLASRVANRKVRSVKTLDYT